MTHDAPDRPIHRAWFCERCGSPLVWTRIENRPRQQCTACGWVLYVDPKVAAGVIVTIDGEMVLLKRAIEPGYGKWVFPGGYVDAGEATEVAAVREASEEAGLDVELTGLLGVYSGGGRRVVLVVYNGRVIGGNLEGNDESLDIRTFEPDRIPWNDLAFETTRQALVDWSKTEQG